MPDEPTTPEHGPVPDTIKPLKATLDSVFQRNNWDYVKRLATDILVNRGHHDADVLEKFLTACLNSPTESSGLMTGVIGRVQGAISATFDFKRNIESFPGQVKNHDYMERFFVGIQTNTTLSPIYASMLANWIYKHRGVYTGGTLIGKILPLHFARKDAPIEDLEKAEILYGPESQEGRAVSARITMSKSTDNHGELLEKDSGERIAGENAEKRGMTRGQLEKRRDDLVGKYNKNNNDLGVVKELAGVYEELEDWENAGTFYQWAHNLSKNDITLEDKADEMKIKQLEKQLNITIAGIKMAGQDVDGQTEVEALEDQIWKSRITCAQKRVNRNPADYEGHFNLGKTLWGDFQRKNEKDITSSLLLTAISHIQRGLKDAKQKNEVRLLLAEIFSFQGLHRIALEHIEEVLKSIQEDMNEFKIKILYLKGTILIAKGESEEAQKCFEDIYAYDVGFKDVGKKVLKQS